MSPRGMIHLLVCLQIMLPVTAHIGTQALGMPAGKWWYNFPSSPLIFEPTNSDASMLDLKRVSLPGEKILSYRLGCLLITDGHVRVTKRLATKDLDLESNRDYFSSASLFRFDIAECKESRPLLAVIEVRFADGGIWTVQDPK